MQVMRKLIVSMDELIKRNKLARHISIVKINSYEELGKHPQCLSYL